jgi:hypothetical protein
VRRKQTAVFTRNANGAQPGALERADEPLVRRTGEHHAHDVELFSRRRAPPADEARFMPKFALKCGNLVSAAVDYDDALSRLPNRLRKSGIRLHTPTDLDDPRHSGNPAFSSSPSIRFAF